MNNTRMVLIPRSVSTPYLVVSPGALQVCYVMWKLVSKFIIRVPVDSVNVKILSNSWKSSLIVVEAQYGLYVGENK